MSDLYDPSNVSVIMNTGIIGGFAEGEMINVTYNSEKWSTHVGAHGDATTVLNLDKSGTWTLNLKQDHVSTRLLTQFAANDTEVTGLIIDNNPGVQRGAGRKGIGGYVERPDFSRGEDLNEPQFEIKFRRIELLTPEV